MAWLTLTASSIIFYSISFPLLLCIIKNIYSGYGMTQTYIQKTVFSFIWQWLKNPYAMLDTEGGEIGCHLQDQA